jgi:hypothetical protein
MHMLYFIQRPYAWAACHVAVRVSVHIMCQATWHETHPCIVAGATRVCDVQAAVCRFDKWTNLHSCWVARKMKCCLPSCSSDSSQTFRMQKRMFLTSVGTGSTWSRLRDVQMQFSLSPGADMVQWVLMSSLVCMQAQCEVTRCLEPPHVALADQLPLHGLHGNCECACWLSSAGLLTACSWLQMIPCQRAMHWVGASQDRPSRKSAVSWSTPSAHG